MNDFTDLPEKLRAVQGSGSRKALVGFDGTVDKLYSVVQNRSGVGSSFSAFPTLDAFGQRISSVAGKSACLEIVPKEEKIGGNGPIMSNALVSAGFPVTYIGPLGNPLEPVFEQLAERMALISLGDPAVTHALEFNDGKLMLPVLQSYEKVTAERLLECTGEDRLIELTREARLIAPLNWSCLPFLSGILDVFLERILPRMDGGDRLFFFDLTDPSKHPPEAIARVLDKLAAFGDFGTTILGLNLSEAAQIAAVLGLPEPTEDRASLVATARDIRERTGLSVVMIHPVRAAACVSPKGEAFAEGLYCPEPRITTGAGDHLNAGFCAGLLSGLSIQDSLRLGVLFSGYYVRTAQSPSLDDISRFIKSDFQTD